MRASLGGLIAASLAVGLTESWDRVGETGGYVVAVIMIAVLVISVAIKQRQFDRKWYTTRAIAESTKTATWRFMMTAKPYDENLPSAEAEALFASELSEFVSATSNVNGLRALLEFVPITTDFMSRARSSSLADRRTLYARDRLEDQQQWYAKKAKVNSRIENKWYWFLLLSEGGSVALALSDAYWEASLLSISGILSTMLAAAFAWLQLRKHGELAEAYSLAAKDLAELGVTISSASESEFLEAVEKAESAISREHTMWRARFSGPS